MKHFYYKRSKRVPREVSCNNSARKKENRFLFIGFADNYTFGTYFLTSRIMTLLHVRTKLVHVSSRVSHAFEQHPIAANSLLCLKLWIAGDFLAQKLESTNTEDSFQFDARRCIQAASYGALICGPIYGFWYPFLDKVSRSSPFILNLPWGLSMSKVFADQLVMDPPVITIFYSYMDTCRYGNFDLDRIRAKLRSEFLTTWLTSWSTWPFVLFATFRYVPVHLQPAVVNFCAILWDGFLSHRNHQSSPVVATTLVAPEECGTVPAAQQQRIQLINTKTELRIKKRLDEEGKEV
jgi:hypothetical protein